MQSRILRFPDECVGELVDERFLSRPRIADACGTVTIIGRPKLILRLGELRLRRPEFLLTFPSDALYGIQFASTAACEMALPYLARLGGIRLLDLSGSGIGDDLFLRCLRSLPSLRAIHFGGTLVSDFGIRDISRSQTARILLTQGRGIAIGDSGAVSIGLKLPRLFALDLSPSGVGDEGLRGLTRLPLRLLNVLGSKITDAGLASLGGTTSLRKLALSHTRISDAGLYFLRSMNRLTLLMLDGTHVTDEGLPCLARLPNMRVLFLSNTEITDKGAQWLSKMTSLRVLSLGRRLSKEAVTSLRKALPDCNITATV